MSRETSADRAKRIQDWASGLTAKQAKTALAKLVRDSSDLSFYETSLAPYWTATGEPLVPGQKTHEDD